jgi:hypothetical protein
METSRDKSLIWCIAYRYDRLVKEHGLLPTRTSDELMDRLVDAHRIQPLDLSSMVAANDLDLVIAVGDIDIHYCQYARKIKDNFVSRYALGDRCERGTRPPQ